MAGIVLFAEWIISAVSGWFEFWLWLVVPPIVAMLISFAGNGRMLSRMKEMGMDQDTERQFVDTVMGPTLKFILWQAILNAAIFGLAFGLRQLMTA